MQALTGTGGTKSVDGSLVCRRGPLLRPVVADLEQRLLFRMNESLFDRATEIVEVGLRSAEEALSK